METTKLKRFAQEARNILLTGVAQRLSTLGINRDGISEKPQVMGGGATFQGTTVSLDFVKTWQSIAHNVENRCYRVVVEEAAYTWFNRLVAIRIMAKNGLIEPLLRYESDTVHIPFIVTEARHGRLPKFTAEQHAKWDAIANDDAKTDEQFMLLISAWCDNNPIIKAAFGSLDDYSSRLIPSNILKDDGFVDMLNHTDYLTDEDYKSPELIGWLYQFYISERKDEVFAKKGKYDSDEIPAATQIFTPNWIVKYMVQNTVGRLYLDANPWETELQKGWKYLVDEPEGYQQRKNTEMLDLEQVKVGDLACGSGHILNELFDTLYAMYLNDGYSPRNAIENILKKNIIGIDIDLRAKQLATFSLLLKECKIDKALSSAPIVPKVLVAPEPFSTVYGDVRGYFPHFFLGEPAPTLFDELADCFKLMEDAKDLGSIIKFTLSDRNREILAAQVAKWESETEIPHGIELGLPYMQFILALTEKYDALTMNPPYMGGGAMNEVLSSYVKQHYPNGKSDLATVFVEMSPRLCKEKGKYGFIIPPSWMFLIVFESLRREIIETQCIDSLLHLSRGVFGADFGSSSFVITNLKEPDAKGVYFRLIERTFQEFDQNHLRILFEKTLENHEFRYKFGNYTKDVEDIVYSEDGAIIYYLNIPQSNYNKLPGIPFGYWTPIRLIQLIDSSDKIKKICNQRTRISTGDNDRFIRFWAEIESRKMFYPNKWIPCPKGGAFRKWYGNVNLVLNWENNGEELKSFSQSGLGRDDYYFKEGLTWSETGSGKTGFRYQPIGAIHEHKGPQIIVDRIREQYYLLGLLNTNINQFILSITSPTISFSWGAISNTPYIVVDDIEDIDEYVRKCIFISKSDWNAHETSWDFEENELILAGKDENTNLKELTNRYKTKWERMFTQLHRNEEELNRRFIEIYGLQDELDYHVPFDEITILQQGEIDHDKTMPVYTVGANGEEVVGYKLHWNDDVIIKQLISYAMGCIMGRYSIDKPGLILANQGDGLEEYDEIVGESRFEVDDDGIVPLMSANLELTDNAPLRFKKWLEAAFGAENLVENLNYVQQALGKTIEAYFQKDFWKDHKKMYQNRPIYWLFTSKKGAFQCLVYMHRMDAYTPERIRTRYLLPHIDWLKRKQDELQQRASTLNTAERRELDNLTKQIAECLEYHDHLHVVADAQQPIDLDDGVVVNYAKFGDVVAKIK